MKPKAGSGFKLFYGLDGMTAEKNNKIVSP